MTTLERRAAMAIVIATLILLSGCFFDMGMKHVGEGFLAVGILALIFAPVLTEND